MTVTLERPSDQRVTARLAGAGSLRAELAAVLDAAQPSEPAAEVRRLILEENIAGKRSATARMWAWKRLKLRYALDSPDSVEYQAFRGAYDRATSASDRGLIVGLMLARTDRLYRDMTLALISPYVQAGGRDLRPVDVAIAVDELRRAHELDWSKESLRSVANHLISSWRDVGLIRPGRGISVAQVRPGPAAASFAAALSKAEGLTDRGVLRSTWFVLLGADEARASDLLREAAASGLLTFKFQADVVEIRFHDGPGGAA